MNNKEIILETHELSKVFPGTIALDHVNFKVYRGAVNALVGENGAGKSTLMNILAGILQPSGGHIVLNGKRVEFKSPVEALRNGIGIIHQELNLFPNMSVVDNIFVGRELRDALGNVDYPKEEGIAHSVLQRLGENIDPKTLVEDLRVGQQQIVAIAKALAQDVRILIMDEPTSALSIKEVKELFNTIRELINEGVTVIYISHKLDEILQIAEYLTILRDGKIVAHTAIDSIDVSWIIEKMVGSKKESFYVHKEHSVGSPILEVRNLSLRHPTLENRYLVDHVTFELNSGEILGIFGLMGSGRTELLECIIGRHPEALGEILLEGKKLSPGGIKGKIAEGLFLIPEDRQRDGLVQSLSTAKNMTLASVKSYFKNLVIDSTKEFQSIQRMIKELSIVVKDPHQSILSLSGGNQQKVIVAKGLLTSPKVLLMDEPTRGIDVNAKRDIFNIMLQLASQGYGIIFVSSELEEILSLSDRILVMCKGKIVQQFSRSNVTEEALIAAASV